MIEPNEDVFDATVRNIIYIILGVGLIVLGFRWFEGEGLVLVMMVVPGCLFVACGIAHFVTEAIYWKRGE